MSRALYLSLQQFKCIVRVGCKDYKKNSLIPDHSFSFHLCFCGKFVIKQFSLKSGTLVNIPVFYNVLVGWKQLGCFLSVGDLKSRYNIFLLFCRHKLKKNAPPPPSPIGLINLEYQLKDKLAILKCFSWGWPKSI